MRAARSGGPASAPFSFLVGKRDPTAGFLVLRDETTRRKAPGGLGRPHPLSRSRCRPRRSLSPGTPGPDLWPVKFNHVEAFHLTYEYLIFHAFVPQDCQNPASAGLAILGFL